MRKQKVLEEDNAKITTTSVTSIIVRSPKEKNRGYLKKKKRKITINPCAFFIFIPTNRAFLSYV